MTEMIKDTEMSDWKIRHTDEYGAYIEALCHMASGYVARIRLRFAERAFEMYKNETVRKLVLAYGAEHKKLEEDRLFWFKSASEHSSTEGALEDSCLNNAKHYAKAVWFLFGMDDDKKEDTK